MLHISGVIVLLHHLVGEGLLLRLLRRGQSRLAGGRDAAVVYDIMGAFMQCNHNSFLLFYFVLKTAHTGLSVATVTPLYTRCPSSSTSKTRMVSESSLAASSWLPSGLTVIKRG